MVNKVILHVSLRDMAEIFSRFYHNSETETVKYIENTPNIYI